VASLNTGDPAALQTVHSALMPELARQALDTIRQALLQAQVLRHPGVTHPPHLGTHPRPRAWLSQVHDLPRLLVQDMGRRRPSTHPRPPHTTLPRPPVTRRRRRVTLPRHRRVTAQHRQSLIARRHQNTARPPLSTARLLLSTARHRRTWRCRVHPRATRRLLQSTVQRRLHTRARLHQFTAPQVPHIPVAPSVRPRLQHRLFTAQPAPHRTTLPLHPRLVHHTTVRPITLLLHLHILQHLHDKS